MSQSVSRTSPTPPLPLINELDHLRLSRWLPARHATGPLAQRLALADLVLPPDMPPDVVTMRSRLRVQALPNGQSPATPCLTPTRPTPPGVTCRCCLPPVLPCWACGWAMKPTGPRWTARSMRCACWSCCTSQRRRESGPADSHPLAAVCPNHLLRRAPGRQLRLMVGVVGMGK